MKEYYTNEDFEVIIKKLEDFISFCSSKNENDIDICIDYFTKNISNCNLLILPIVPYQGELTLYHLRLNIQESENKESIVPFSYCPQDALKSVPLGRLNLKQQAVFYSSTSPETCVKEMKIQVGKERAVAYISVWEVLREQIFNGFITFSPNILKLSNHDKEFEKNLMNKLSFIGSEKGLERYLRTLGRIMLGDSYIPSAILANYLFNNVSTSDNIKIDCIIYPSVQENTIIYDYAFTPKAVDKFLKPMCICMGTLYKEGNFKIANSLIGVADGNLINWQKTDIIPYEKIKFTKCKFIYTMEMEKLNLPKEKIGQSILFHYNSNKEYLSDKISFENEYHVVSLKSFSLHESIKKKDIDLHDELEFGKSSVSCPLKPSDSAPLC